MLPPAALEPMRRYRQPPPPRRSTGKFILKAFGWLLLALVVIATGLAGGVYLYGHETLDAISAHSAQAKATAKDKHVTPIASPTEPATALVIGYDTRKGADAKLGQESRSDTLMLVRADPANKTLSLMSFPRDLVVPIYCNGSDVPRTHDRINSAWSTCGEQGTLDTIAHLTHIPINFVITVDFHGFKLLVNKLHGVYVDVDHRYYIPPNSGTSAINLEPGYQKLDGGDALAFVRFRHTDDDITRNARQQLFLDSLKDRLATSFHLTELPGLVGAIKGSVEVVQSGGGTPKLSVLQSYLGLGYSLPPGHLFRTQIPNLVNCGYLNAEVCTSDGDITSAVDTFMHPDVTVSSRANCQAIGCKVKPSKTKELKPSQITTLVLNGTTIAGLAGNTSYKLAVAGFHTVQLPPTIRADAPRADYYSSYVYFDPVQPASKAAARTLQQALGSNTLVAPLPPEIAPYAEQAHNPLVTVVLGTSFGGEVTSPTAHVQELPPPQPPQVKDYSAYTRPAVQEKAKELPFKALYPSVIESSSQFTTMEPVRVFKPAAHHKELVLTFVTGAQNIYWQVIETDWNDAPALRAPTGKYLDRKTGRRFDVFTTSGHIHLIVYRANGASYWVYNTLEDKLSNKTMLAIARGLRPLGK
ncbi:MAG TPA: LCP family protein [Gaiellaceae bacterium]|nr:LCP family protein [Gaiellaceae bacterium]